MISYPPDPSMIKGYKPSASNLARLKYKYGASKMFNKKIELNDQVSSTFSGYIILMNCTVEGNAPTITIDYLVKRTEQIRTKTFKYHKQDVMYSDYDRLRKSGMY